MNLKKKRRREKMKFFSDHNTIVAQKYLHGSVVSKLIL